MPAASLSYKAFESEAEARLLLNLEQAQKAPCAGREQSSSSSRIFDGRSKETWHAGYHTMNYNEQINVFSSTFPSSPGRL